MSKMSRLVLILVVLFLVVTAAWVGCDALGQFVRVMHSRHGGH